MVTNECVRIVISRGKQAPAGLHRSANIQQACRLARSAAVLARITYNNAIVSHVVTGGPNRCPLQNVTSSVYLIYAVVSLWLSAFHLLSFRENSHATSVII